MEKENIHKRVAESGKDKNGDCGKELKKAKKKANSLTNYEVLLRHDGDGKKLAETILADFDKNKEKKFDTIVLSQDETGFNYQFHIKPILNAIASLESVTHLRFINVGGSRGKDRAWLEEFTPFFQNIGPRLESVVIDGGSLAVSEGFPACEGPMGMEEFEDAIRIMENCQQFDLFNGFSIQYLGNPALGFFPTPQSLSLYSILNTIRKLPKLTKENAAKINATDEDAEAVAAARECGFVLLNSEDGSSEDDSSEDGSSEDGSSEDGSPEDEE